VLERIFLSGAQRRLFAKGVPVFCYHSLGPAAHGARDPFLWVVAAEFSQQLAALRVAGFENGTLDDVVNPANAGRKAVITFDDGCRNVIEHGLEPLRQHGFTAIQFLVAGMIGGQNDWDVRKGDAPVPLMNHDEVQTWLAAGHQIGSHPLTHPVLTKCANAREEISASKKKLEDEFGVEVRHFCYPHGKWDERVRDLVREAGYTSACTVAPGVAMAGEQMFTLPRFFAYSGTRLAAKALHRLFRR
jgi:peptidoglycan/xylan/chitin deacetylase (PgdA/CDA1 family)